MGVQINFKWRVNGAHWQLEWLIIWPSFLPFLSSIARAATTVPLTSLRCSCLRRSGCEGPARIGSGRRRRLRTSCRCSWQRSFGWATRCLGWEADWRSLGGGTWSCCWLAACPPSRPLGKARFLRSCHQDHAKPALSAKCCSLRSSKGSPWSLWAGAPLRFPQAQWPRLVIQCGRRIYKWSRSWHWLPLGWWKPVWAIRVHSEWYHSYIVLDINDEEDRSVGVFSENFVDLDIMCAEWVSSSVPAHKFLTLTDLNRAEMLPSSSCRT